MLLNSDKSRGQTPERSFFQGLRPLAPKTKASHTAPALRLWGLPWAPPPALCCSGLGPQRPRGEPQTAGGPARVCRGLGDAPVKRHRVGVQGLTATGSSSQPLTFADRDVVVATSGLTGIRQVSAGRVASCVLL